MLDWFLAGGFNMYFLAVLAIVMIATAARFARNADPHRLSILRALSWALVATTLTGFVGGLVATCRFVIDRPEAAANPLPYLLQGFSESCSNLVFGGSIAVITWILVAVGVRRLPRDNA
jgi:uncharacterized membrane protein